MSGRPAKPERKAAALVIVAVVIAVLTGGLVLLDRAFPPDLSRLADLSPTVADKNGRTLAVFINRADAYRQPAAAGDVPPHFVNLLLAYEDQRFFSHWGVDPLAAARAAAQNLAAARVVSGASTLTMQTARLLEPRPRGLRAKALQSLRALQLERRFTKAEILAMYLTLAPYGGNVEGVRAAAWAWFGKPAAELTLGESALLAALPRAPSLLRPDRADPGALRQARGGVIARGLAAGVIDPQRAAEAMAEPLPGPRRPFPMTAPHAARALIAQAQAQAQAQNQTPAPDGRIKSTLDGPLQQAVEQLLTDALGEQGAHAGLAALVVDNRSRKVRAYVGAPAPFDDARNGAVDMTRAARSPGSALKPFIYGLGFSLGTLHPETLVADVSTRFGDYAPQNFDRGFHGDLTVREALQRSLNVPAVLALQKIGPQRFVHTLEGVGTTVKLPAGETAPGLPVALGGVGVSLWDLTRLYAALAGDGVAKPLILREDAPPDSTAPASPAAAPVLMSPEAARATLRILEGTPAPDGRVTGAERRGQSVVALKTGTSFGFRDAWAFGVSADMTVGVWVGRPDGAPSPGRYGALAAAPLVYRIFDLLPPASGRPSGQGTGQGAGQGTGQGGLAGIHDGKGHDSRQPPDMLRRVNAGRASPITARDPLRLIFPQPGALVALSDPDPLVLEARGGRRPFTWLVDGRPLPPPSPLARTIPWRPTGPGAARVTVVDADGAAASAVISAK